MGEVLADMIAEEIAGLDWNQPKEVQAAAKKAIKLKIGNDLSPLMIRNLQKSQWENAAEILESLDPSRVAPFTPDLLEWMKDMNWPGANRVFDMLIQFQKHELLPDIDSAISKAREDADEDWVDSLLILREEVCS